ncbi:MAG: FG-GAP-like repeat-containing protein [Phycisphaerales bacterium]
MSFLVLSHGARGQDLNGNFTPDSAELRAGAADCNRNGVLDSVDVSRPHFSNAIEHLNGLQPSQNNVWDVCPIDFNQDGRADLALCAFTSTNFGNIALWRNEGGPGLVFQGEIAFANARPTIIKSADLNSDGRPDLVSADSSFNRVYVMLATGSGTFAPAVTLAGDASNNGSVGLALGDLDGDGDVDVAATSWGTNRVNVWRNSGNGTFGPRGTFATEFQPRDVAIGDFTGDGLADLAVANEYYAPNPASANGTVSLLRNTGGAVFVSHATIAMPIGNTPFNYQARPQFVELKDIDHDGDVDLITSSKLANTLAIHLNSGSGGFSLGQRFGGANIEGDARDVQVADLDGDGWEEIVWGDPEQNNVAILRNTLGTFWLHQNFATSIYGSLYLGVADFSGDGRPDIVSANDAARTFSILVNTGGLNFDAPIHLRPDEYPQNLTFADFNNDGVTDMCTLRSNYAQTVWNIAVYPGQGNAVFSKTPIDTPVGSIGVLYPRDVNHDGNMDLIDLYGHCLVYLGNGDGTFQLAIDSNLVVRYLRSVIADLNVDGNLDLAWVVAGHPGSYSVSLGDGAGRFGPATSYTMLAEDESVGVGDINGDGAPELFAGFRQQLAPPAGGVLSWLPNNGDGTFGARQDRFITASPLSPAVGAIAVADVDADGDRDVVVAALGLRLYRNPGDGALPEVPEIVNQTGVSELFATDIDLDGDIDLYGRGTTGIAFLNTGAGMFAPPMFLHRYDSNARGFVVADVDDDGRPDLVIRPENSWGTFVFLNHDQWSADANGNGVPDECEAPPPCPADFNGDGAANSQDFFDFLGAFFGSLPAADFNGDGTINSQDFFEYVTAFFAGC